MEQRPVMDLHMHSSVSDGTDTPAELLERVRAAGLRLFSVTDHDDIKGCRIILNQLQAQDPHFLTGVEFSCRDELGQYHVLGYRYDPEAPAIRQVVQTGHSYRMFKLQARLDALQREYGIVFPEEDVAALRAMDNPGKPHIGNLMVKYGYAPDRNTAIGDMINKMHVPEKHVRPEEAIRGILDAGGIPVLAHPSYGNGDQIIVGEEMDARLRRLTAFGLQGVEAFYSGFSKKLRDEMLDFAARYGLYVTAGSDYHGKNKLIEIGDTGLHPDACWPDGLVRFLRDTDAL